MDPASPPTNLSAAAENLFRDLSWDASLVHPAFPFADLSAALLADLSALGRNATSNLSDNLSWDASFIDLPLPPADIFTLGRELFSNHGDLM